MNYRLLFIAVLAATILQGQSPEAETPYKAGGTVSSPRIASKVDPTYTPKHGKLSAKEMY